MDTVAINRMLWTDIICCCNEINNNWIWWQHVAMACYSFGMRLNLFFQNLPSADAAHEFIALFSVCLFFWFVKFLVSFEVHWNYGICYWAAQSPAVLHSIVNMKNGNLVCQILSGSMMYCPIPNNGANSQKTWKPFRIRWKSRLILVSLKILNNLQLSSMLCDHIYHFFTRSSSQTIGWK